MEEKKTLYYLIFLLIFHNLLLFLFSFFLSTFFFLFSFTTHFHFTTLFNDPVANRALCGQSPLQSSSSALFDGPDSNGRPTFEWPRFNGWPFNWGPLFDGQWLFSWAKGAKRRQEGLWPDPWALILDI